MFIAQSEIHDQKYCSSKKKYIFAREFAGVAQLVEHDLAKVGVAGSSPVSRSIQKKAVLAAILFFTNADDRLA